MSWSNSRSGAAGGRGIARAALLLVPLALAACGSVLPGGGAGSASPQSAQSPNKAVPLPSPLCMNPGAVDHLVVRRTGVISRVQEQRFTFPALVTVTSAADARAVARALCALPAQPAGITNCPADFGIGYQLRFAAGRHHFHVVTLQATGCEIVTGLGKPRTIARTPAFWAVLGNAMRLHFPVARKVFAGPFGGRNCEPASTQLGQVGNCPESHQPG
jgi:hypothetical protein